LPLDLREQPGLDVDAAAHRGRRVARLRGCFRAPDRGSGCTARHKGALLTLLVRRASLRALKLQRFGPDYTLTVRCFGSPARARESASCAAGSE
jgi:hypothetical protein